MNIKIKVKVKVREAIYACNKNINFCVSVYVENVC